jgi:hypothetical protein
MIEIADRGNWLQTCSGIRFFPLDPRPEEIKINDIAGALSKMCRFGGHSKRFYSVAEHCVLMSRAATTPFKRAALLHDASEAYLVDIPRPVKPMLANYSLIEDKIMQTIAFKFGFVWPLQKEVKILDSAILADEQAQVMVPIDHAWDNMQEPLGISLEFWSPDKAEAEFLSQYIRLFH